MGGTECGRRFRAGQPWPACRMASVNADTLVRLDLDNPVFQAHLLGLQKPKRHAALDTLNKIRRLT